MCPLASRFFSIANIVTSMMGVESHGSGWLSSDYSQSRFFEVRDTQLVSNMVQMSSFLIVIPTISQVNLTVKYYLPDSEFSLNDLWVEQKYSLFNGMFRMFK